MKIDLPFVITMAVFVVVCAVLTWYTIDNEPGYIEITSYTTAETTAAEEVKTISIVNINTADAEELQLLPGIGEVRAAAIVEHRKTHGPFRDAEGLLDVAGIGVAVLEQLREFVVVE